MDFPSASSAPAWKRASWRKLHVGSSLPHPLARPPACAPASLASQPASQPTCPRAATCPPDPPPPVCPSGPCPPWTVRSGARVYPLPEQEAHQDPAPPRGEISGRQSGQFPVEQFGDLTRDRLAFFCTECSRRTLAAGLRDKRKMLTRCGSRLSSHQEMACPMPRMLGERRGVGSRA